MVAITVGFLVGVGTGIDGIRVGVRVAVAVAGTVITRVGVRVGVLVAGVEGTLVGVRVAVAVGGGVVGIRVGVFVAVFVGVGLGQGLVTVAQQDISVGSNVIGGPGIPMGFPVAVTFDRTHSSLGTPQAPLGDTVSSLGLKVKPGQADMMVNFAEPVTGSIVGAPQLGQHPEPHASPQVVQVVPVHIEGTGDSTAVMLFATWLAPAVEPRSNALDELGALTAVSLGGGWSTELLQEESADSERMTMKIRSIMLQSLP